MTGCYPQSNIRNARRFQPFILFYILCWSASKLGCFSRHPASRQWFFFGCTQCHPGNRSTTWIAKEFQVAPNHCHPQFGQFNCRSGFRGPLFAQRQRARPPPWPWTRHPPWEQAPKPPGRQKGAGRRTNGLWWLASNCCFEQTEKNIEKYLFDLTRSHWDWSKL